MAHVRAQGWAAALAIGGCLATPAWAGSENRNAFPFGEKEALTGNAGVAGTQSTGAVYYNPAALTQIDHGRISLSGSTYVYLKTGSDQFAHLDNTDIPYTSSGFDTVPSTVVSTFRVNDEWVASYFILIPEKYKQDNRQTFLTPNSRTTYIELKNANDMWAGVAAGYAYSDQFSFGAALNLIQHTELSSTTVQTTFPSIPNSILFRVDHLESSVTGLSLVLGALYRPGGPWQFGLRVQTPLVKLFGSGNGFTSGQVVDLGTLDSAEKEEQDIRAAYKLPFDVTFGTRYQLNERWSLLADLSVQTGASYDPYPGSVFSRSVTVSATPRINLGAEAEFSQGSSLGIGLFYNPSAIHTLAGRAQGSTRSDFVGITTGYIWTSGRIRTGLGLFYLWSKGELIPYSDLTVQPTAYRKIGLGALLSISYYL